MGNPWVGGGGAVRAYELCRRLADRGHEITIISGRYPSSKDYKEGGLSYKFLGSAGSYILSTFSYAIKAAGFVKRYGNEFDIIVEDFAPWNPVFSRFLTKRPVILHINHKEGINILKRWLVFGLLFFLIEAFYPRLYRHVTALSEWTKKKIKIPGAVVIPAGVGALPRAQIRGDAVPYIIYIGRLHIKNKGLDTLLNAMKGLDIRLLIVGRGRDEGKLKEMAGMLKLENVEFTGFLNEEEKTRALMASEVFVLPSRFEGWGIVVLEAALCSKPVIVSDIPELSFAVEAGFGASFRAGDSKDLKDKINLLLGNKTLRDEMAEKAGEYVKDYTWDSISEQYEKYLQGVCVPGQ